MSSYSDTNLSTSELDDIRLEIADTGPTNFLLTNNEINYLVTQERNFWSAAARCCEVISRKFFQNATETRLGRALQVSYANQSTQYADMAKRLRQKALGTVVPWVGGMSVSDKISYMQDTDIVQPLFTKTMMENPRTGGYTSDSLDPVGGGTSADTGANP